jgi:hypothetical protein
VGGFQIRVADRHAGHVEIEAQESAALLSELRFVRERANELEPQALS